MPGLHALPHVEPTFFKLLCVGADPKLSSSYSSSPIVSWTKWGIKESRKRNSQKMFFI